MRARVASLAAVAVSFLAIGGWFLLPTSVGGRATYVVTHGVSMQPRFQTGDLAIVYPASGYRTGQVAAYRSNLLHTVVLHRIVATTPDRYIFKGDNNSWLDPEHPGGRQMVGRLGIRVPNGGAVLGWLHNPLVTALLAVAITFTGATGATGLRRLRRRGARAERASMSLHSLPTTSHPRSVNIAVAGAITLLAAGLAAATYAVPGQSMQAEKVPWTTQVSYAYTAATSPNLVYPDGEVHPGQTVFRKLVNRLTVSTTWSLHTRAGHHIEGTARLQAIVHGPPGWTHPIDLGKANAITDEPVTLTGTLDLAALDALVSHAGNLTGVPADHYTVSVQPLVDLTGTLAGLPFKYRSTRPEPALTLDVTHATVAPAGGGSSTIGDPAATSQPSSTADSGAASLKWLAPKTNTHTTSVTRPGTPAWDLVGHRVPLTSIRWASMSATALGLLTLMVLLIAQPNRKDPCIREARRHRGSIIAVSGLRVGPAGNVLEVASMRALTHVAQRYDRLILQPVTTPGVYLVEDETGLYRYHCTHGATRADPRRHLADRPRAQGAVAEPA